MSSTTISSNYFDTYTISASIPIPYVTVEPGVQVDGNYPYEGIYFLGSGGLTNSGQIGGGVGVRIIGYGSVTNFSNIYGIEDGIDIGGGTIINSGRNAIIQAFYHNAIYGNQVNVVNDGVIKGNGYGDGIGILTNDGTILNTGLYSVIAGVRVGVEIGAGVVDNYGLVQSFNIHSTAVEDNGGATIVNASSRANIIGGQDGVNLGSVGTLINQGTVTAFSAAGGRFPNPRAYYAVGMNYGGLVNNSNIYALISGQNYGVEGLSGNATVLNIGTIAASGIAVEVAGGLVSNSSTGIIAGGNTGVVLQGANPTTLINHGTISGATAVLAAGNSTVDIYADSVFQGNIIGQGGNAELNLVNPAGGTFDLGRYNVSGFGTINFGSNAAWVLESPKGNLNNGATITGFNSNDTIVLSGVTAKLDSFSNGKLALYRGDGLPQGVLNIAGSFTSANFHVTNAHGVTTITEVPVLTNAMVAAGSSQTLASGQNLGSLGLAGGTLDIAGTAASTINTLAVTGANPAISFANGGAITINNSLSILSGSTLTIAGGAVVIDGSLSLSGAITEVNAKLYDNGVLVNNGNITLDPSSLTVASLSGTGTVTIETGSTLDVLGNIDAGETIVFTGSHGVLGITDTAAIDGLIDVAGTNATIDVTNLGLGSITSSLYSGGILTLNYSGASSPLELTLSGVSSVLLGSDGNGGTDINIPCFVSGTHVLTETGETLVEDIRVGDSIILARAAGPVTSRVVWTGSRAINLRQHPVPAAVRPVRIVAGAICSGVPERDLRLSPDHAVYLGGHLFRAIDLINGSTIYQEQLTTHVTYHHIELEAHDILLAEGLACESFLDTGNRMMFAHVSGLLPAAAAAEPARVVALHPDFAAVDGGFCVPLVREGDLLEAARARINQRAASHCQVA